MCICSFFRDGHFNPSCPVHGLNAGRDTPPTTLDNVTQEIVPTTLSDAIQGLLNGCMAVVAWSKVNQHAHPPYFVEDCQRGIDLWKRYGAAP